MICHIIRDENFLKVPSREANMFDLATAADLEDTLRSNFAICSGMAANMIGRRVRIMAVSVQPDVLILINPVITNRKGEYETEEGCLSLDGTRKTTRYREITVEYKDKAFVKHSRKFTGYIAQVIQHEYDHFEGRII